MNGASADARRARNPLVCLNPNPSIDRTMILDELVIGDVNRAKASSEAAGGKGAIVARTTQHLGHDAICCGPIGGRAGDAVRKMAEAEGLTATWVPVAGDTRVNTTIVSNGVGAGGPCSNTRTAIDTIVNEAGPVISSEEWDAYCDVAGGLANDGGVACISGSFPPGVDGDQARGLVEALESCGAKTFIDTHGTALAAIAKARPWCIKINQVEAAAFLGSAASHEADAPRDVRALATHVMGVAIITLGGDGAVVATPDGWVAQVSPAPIEAVSAVGSGDAFLAGLASSTLAGRSLDEAIRCAAASGAANAQAGLQGVVDRSVVESLMDAVEVTVLTEAEPT